MTVVKAEAQHLDVICELYEQYFRYFTKQEPYIYQTAEANREYYQSALASEKEEHFIAFDGDMPIGLCHVSEKKTPPVEFYVEHRFAVLMEMFVAVSHRGTNISNQLMSEAKKWTKERSLDYLELRVLDLDEYARSLYEREGFDITSHTMRCIMK